VSQSAHELVSLGDRVTTDDDQGCHLSPGVGALSRDECLRGLTHLIRHEWAPCGGPESWRMNRGCRGLVHGLEPSRTEGGACPPNRSGDRWHPNHCAELVSRIRDWEWLTRHVEP
jgi:hypothetical protein